MHSDLLHSQIYLYFAVDEANAAGGRKAHIRDVYEGYLLRPVRRWRGPEQDQTHH